MNACTVAVSRHMCMRATAYMMDYLPLAEIVQLHAVAHHTSSSSYYLQTMREGQIRECGNQAKSVGVHSRLVQHCQQQ